MCSRWCRERRAVGREHSPEELQCWSYGCWMCIFPVSLAAACLSGSCWSTDRWRWARRAELVWPRWSPQTGSSHKPLVYLDVAEHNAVPCWLHRPQTCLLCRQTEENPASVQWCHSGGPAPVFQMTSWPQTLEPQACSHLVLYFWVYLGWRWWWNIWSMKGHRTVPVICWISLWRWGPFGQYRISDRMVWHHLGLVLFSFSASGRPGAPRLCWSDCRCGGEGGCWRN